MDKYFFKISILVLALFVGLMVSISGCKKDDINTSPDVKLTFSTDSVNFDTVFSSVGTATYQLKVYNNDDSYINVGKIRLSNDPNNSFRINVDGLPGENFTDVEIGPNDSIYIFVEATVTPNGNVLYPFVEGEIQFETNGNAQKVKLVAWGWDAIFYVPNVFPTNGLPDFTLVDPDTLATVTWTADRPIVIKGYVVVDEFQKLIIEPGTQIFFHDGGGLWIFSGGIINAIGSQEAPIVFQGDRLDPYFDELPGQWDRIWVNESEEDQIFEHVIIKNNFIGIQVESDPFGLQANPSVSDHFLQLKNVAIRNNSVASIFSKNYRLKVQNAVLSNGGQYLFAGTGGGEYHFEHTTFANNWSSAIRQTPAVYITNVTQVDASTIAIGSIVDSEFTNCIIYGNGFNELGLDFDDQGAVDLKLKYCLIKGEEEEMTPYIDAGYIDDSTPNYIGQEPGFIDFSNGDFRPLPDAFILGKGDAISGLSNDIVGTPYANPPVLGCFEYLK